MKPPTLKVQRTEFLQFAEAFGELRVAEKARPLGGAPILMVKSSPPVVQRQRIGSAFRDQLPAVVRAAPEADAYPSERCARPACEENTD